MANTLYPQLQAFTLYSSGANIGDTTLVLSSFKTIDGVQLAMSDFGDKGFLTLEPGAGTNEEQISFSGVTANSNGTTTLTGVKNVLALSPYTETSGLAKPHSGGTTAVVSVSSGLLNQLSNKGNDETVTGKWSFPTYTSSDVNQVATISYANALAIAGAPDASTTVKGVSEEATQAEVDAGTGAGGTSARLFVNPSSLITSKYGRTMTAFGGYAADAGSTDAYAITMSPALTSYVIGQVITFKANTRNTGAATLNVNALGAVTIKKDVDQDLDTGDIKANSMVEVVYDGTNFQMISRTGVVPTGATIPFGGRTAPGGYVLADGSEISRSTYAALFAVLCPTLGTVTITIAAPGVVTLSSHGLATGDSIYLTTSGALPTGLMANTRYWVVKNDANSFWLATSLADALAGTKITTSGSQSGTHTATGAYFGVGDGSTTFNVPSMKGLVVAGLDQTQTEFAGLGQTGGEKTHVLTATEMPAHTHGAPVDNSGTGGTARALANTNGAGTQLNTSSTGSDTAHNNIQPYVTMPYIIKV